MKSAKHASLLGESKKSGNEHRKIAGCRPKAELNSKGLK